MVDTIGVQPGFLCRSKKIQKHIYNFYGAEIEPYPGFCLTALIYHGLHPRLFILNHFGVGCVKIPFCFFEAGKLHLPKFTPPNSYIISRNDIHHFLSKKPTRGKCHCAKQGQRRYLKKASAFTIMNGNEAAVRIAIKNNYPEKATEFLELANEGMKQRRDRIQVLKAL